MPLCKQQAAFLHVGLTACAVLLLGQGAAAERCERKQSRALVAINKSAAASNADMQIEPITMAILGGVAALGSLGSMGKTVHGLIQNKKDIVAAKQLIQKFGELSTQGCSMLAKVGDVLAEELRDLQQLTRDNALYQACNQPGTFNTYFEVLRRELHYEAKRVPVSIREQFSAVYIQGFNLTLLKVCDLGNEALQQNQKERILSRLWRMDGIMEATCGLRMPALQNMNSLLQSNSKAQASTGELFAILGLAYTVFAFMDMAVDVADSTINYMWGSSTKMLSTFLQTQLEKMEKMLCDRSKAMLAESALTIHAGRAVKLAKLDMELFDGAEVPFSKAPDFLRRTEKTNLWPITFSWGLEQDSFWLCGVKKRCLQRFETKFATSEKLRNDARVGWEQPYQCLRKRMASICSEDNSEIDLAVPSSCFASVYVSTSTSQRMKTQMGISKLDVEWNFWALQFHPSFTLNSDFDRNGLPDMTQCIKPLEALAQLERDLDRDLDKTERAMDLGSFCSA